MGIKFCVMILISIFITKIDNNKLFKIVQEIEQFLQAFIKIGHRKNADLKSGTYSKS